MHVMFHQNARIALVVFVSLSLLATGCRSTRNGLSSLPGMSWLAAEEVPSWGSDAEGPGLPPPSSEATPQLTTTGTTNQDSYPDTGYQSPYNESDIVRSGGSYPTGHFNESNSIKASDGVEAATVGNTQQGFYGDDYPDDNQGVAGNDSSSNNNYDRYSESYAGQDYSSNASDADPRFERLGNGGQDSTDVDPYERDAHGDLSTPEESNALRDGYDRFSQGIRDGAEAIAEGAERMNERVQDFAREQGDNIRSTVRDGYDRLPAADDPYAADNASVDSAGTDSHVGDAYSDYPPADTTNDAYNDYPQDNYDDYPQRSYDQTTGPSEQQPAASLNPPTSDGYDRSSDVPGVEQSAPRRSVQPWRPGSTGTYRSSSLDPRTQPYQDVNAVAPASFPGRATDSLQPGVEPADAYPDHGWQSHSDGSAQRLSPNYR